MNYDDDDELDSRMMQMTTGSLNGQNQANAMPMAMSGAQLGGLNSSQDTNKRQWINQHNTWITNGKRDEDKPGQHPDPNHTWN